MSQTATKNEAVIKDSDCEARVSSQKAPRAVTHTIALIPPNFVHTLWDDVNEYLAPAVARSNGRWDMQSLYESMRKMEQNLWVAFNDDNIIEGVGITECFNSWAKDNECDGLEAVARHGFWKWLEQDGFIRSYTTYEKEV